MSRFARLRLGPSKFLNRQVCIRFKTLVIEAFVKQLINFLEILRILVFFSIYSIFQNVLNKRSFNETWLTRHIEKDL